MFILNNLAWNFSNNFCSKFAFREQNLSFVNPSSITSLCDFSSTPRGNATFLFSSDTNFFHHPSIYSDALVAFYLPAKWLLVHKKQLLADLPGPLGSALTFFNDCTTFFPLLAFAGNVLYPMWLNSTIFPEGVIFLFLFLNHPNIWCINADIWQWWCTFPVCRHTWCWWRCSYVKIVLSFMPSHHCWWTMQDDCQCVNSTKNEEIHSLLGLAQSILTNVQMAFLNSKWNIVIVPAMTFWNTKDFYMHIFLVF